jgi:tRNA(Ile)-lysidine synthase
VRASVAEVELRHAVQVCLEIAPAVTRGLVACSGGPDSIALAATAAWVAQHTGIAMGAVVVDHGVQSDSAQVAQVAADACRTFGLDPVIVERVHVGHDGGFEAAARSARYAGLERVAIEVDADAVLLGHTQHDQAETVLLRLLRGSGARSLAAMRPITGLWRRPFLAVSRHQVHAVAEEIAMRTGVRIWRDPHNTDPAFARIQVRHLLEQWPTGETAIAGLARSAALLADDADALDAQAAVLAETLIEDDSIAVQALADLPRALRTRIVRIFLHRSGCPEGSVEFDHVRAVEALITSWHGQGAVALPGGVSAFRAYERLRASHQPRE